MNATGAATLSSTLDVAGDVDVNSGKFAVTASDGSLAISSNKFTVAGNTGNTVVAGTLDADQTTLIQQRRVEHAGCDGMDSLNAVEHAGCGRRRGREQWEVCGDGIGPLISSNKFTVAGERATVVALELRARWM